MRNNGSQEGVRSDIGERKETEKIWSSKADRSSQGIEEKEEENKEVKWDGKK